MFIPEFWCGVLATVGVLFVLLIVAAAVSNSKDKK